ncbi:MAG: hypothetical protein JZU53_08780 [Paludibacter sp.]|nr:hypothetical protein [Paludibacter sp.]
MKKHKIMTPKINIIIFFFVMFFLSCEKEQLKFESPSVTILTTKKISNNAGIIKYKVNRGYGANIKDFYIEFYDITDTTAQVIKKNLYLNNSPQFTDSVLLNELKNKHDYRVILKLKSEKNEFKSASTILSLSSNYDESFLGITGCDLNISSYDEMYIEEYNGFLAKPLRKGQYFLVDIYFSDTFLSKNKYEFKLNDNISLTPDPTYTSYSDYVFWGMKIPDNIPAGVYTLDLYVNGKKFTAYSKIRIFSGTYSETNIPVMPIVLYPSWQSTEFILQNKIYFIYQYDVAYYDMSKNIWVKRNSISSNDANIGVGITDANFNYNNSQYLFVHYFSRLYQIPGKLNLLKYNETIDNWDIITNYPDSDDNVFAFRLGNSVYVGYKKFNNKRFWEYNLNTNVWTAKKNLPDDMHGYVTGNCENGTTGFIITNYRELWQYNPTNDNWTLLCSLNAGPYNRSNTRLLYNKNYIYALGGITDNNYELGDFWRYNLDTKMWEFIWQCQYTYNLTASKFIVNDKILMIPCVGYNTNCKAEITF